MAVAIADRQHGVRVVLRLLRRATSRALAAVGRPGADVEVHVVDDGEIRRLNSAFRGVRRSTDVLAFPLEVPGSAARLLGQIVISADAARRQARRVGVPLAAEMDLLVTHGVLHLVGWDDRDPVEADLMHRREREVLGSAGVRSPARLWRGLLGEQRHSARGPRASLGAPQRDEAHPRRLRPRGPRYQ